MLSIGTGKARIDLGGVLPFDGFDAVRDPLHVRAVVFENPDGSRACLVSADATSMRDDAMPRAAAAEAVGCSPDDVWVTVTHTFSSPHVRTPEHLASDEERTRNALLAERLASAVKTACASAVSDAAFARLEVACGRCSVNANRDVETDEGWWLGVNPDGFSDRSVRVLRAFARDDDRTIAVLYTVDVQPSVVQGLRDVEGRTCVSADFVGEASRILEERLGGVAVFLVGAAGDQTPRAKGPGALAELGLILASETEAALMNSSALPVDVLRLSSVMVSCPAQRRADFHSLAPTRSYDFVPEGTQDTLLSIARLGRLTVVGVQPEIDSVLGARLRGAAPGRIELLTMVNGAQKYLPSSRSYDLITYEAMNSSFARGSDEVLAAAALCQIKERP